jgi:hypothetical protein
VEPDVRPGHADPVTDDPARPAPAPVPAVRRWTPVLAAAAAVGAHLTVGVVYAVSGLLAPVWAVVALAVWWLVLGALLVALAVRRSLWTLAVPFVAIASWVLVISAGGAWLGWTA